MGVKSVFPRGLLLSDCGREGKVSRLRHRHHNLWSVEEMTPVMESTLSAAAVSSRNVKDQMRSLNKGIQTFTRNSLWKILPCRTYTEEESKSTATAASRTTVVLVVVIVTVLNRNLWFRSAEANLFQASVLGKQTQQVFSDLLIHP